MAGLNYMPSLPPMYGIQLHTQLYLEELQHCVDVRQFDLQSVTMEPARGCRTGEIPKALLLKVRGMHTFPL